MTSVDDPAARPVTASDRAPSSPPPTPPPDRRPVTTRPRLTRERWQLVALYLVGLLIGLGIWTLLHQTQGSNRVSSPIETWDALRELHSRGDLWASIQISGQRIILGWGFGLLVGVPAGIAMGQSRVLRSLLEPYLQFLRFIPPIAFISLAIIWFGIGETSKVVLIFYTCVFIITINTIAGVQAVDESRLRAAASLGAGPARRLVTVTVPSTVPYIFTAARLAMGNAFLTIVSAELVAASDGVGALIWTARNFGRTDWIFAGIFILGFMGLAADLLLRLFGNVALRRFAVKA